MLNALDKIGHVDIIQLNPTGPYGERDEVSIIEKFGRRIILVETKWQKNLFKRYKANAFVTNGVSSLLSYGLEQYDYMVSRYILGAAMLKVPKSILRFADLDDMIYRTAYPSTGVPRRYFDLKSVKRLVVRQFELNTAKGLDGGFVLAERDMAVVSGIPVALLPNIADARSFIPEVLNESAELGPQILFVGTLTWEPNRRGLTWFLDNCLPALRTAIPNIRVAVVGFASKEYEEVLINYPNVKYYGFVKSLEKFYSESRVVIAPIFEGGGALVKIVEAISFSRPLVTSKFAADGYAGVLAPGVDLLVANNPDEFSSQIFRLLSDPDFCVRVARSAHYKLISKCNVESFDFVVRNQLVHISRLKAKALS